MAPLATISESETSGPPEVISIGLWRMGTASMAKAYDIMGLRPHHAMDLLDEPEQWKLFEHAADGTWPDPKTGKLKGKPFTRQDWDKIYGKYGAITELGSAFAEQLIAAYPDAKVVICRRDFDRWWPSLREGIVLPLYNWKNRLVFEIFSLVLGRRGGYAMIKTTEGFFHSYSAEDFERNTKGVYDEYFTRIEQIVPPERRLTYKLGDGWEPLCEFLGKPIPSVEFPKINDGEALREHQKEAVEKWLVVVWSVLKPWTFGSIGVVLGFAISRISFASG